MRVRLTRKLANLLNGIDFSTPGVGDIIDLSHHEAELLLAEGWARLESDEVEGVCQAASFNRRRRLRR